MAGGGHVSAPGCQPRPQHEAVAEHWGLVGLRSPRRRARMGAGASPLHPAAHFHASFGNSSPRGSGALPNLAEGGKEALGEGWQRCQHHVLNAACAGGTKSNPPAAVLLRPSQALCALQDLGAELSTPARPHKTSTNWGCLPELLLLKDDFEELSSLSLFIKPKQAGVPALLLSRDPASTRGAH